MEQQLPGLTVAAGPQQDRVGFDGEDRGEADAELADLREVTLLGRREHPGELGVDQRLVHPLAEVVHVDLEHPLRGAIGGGLEAGPDLDPGCAGVDGVLHQLTEEIEGAGELMDEVVQGLIGQPLDLVRRSFWHVVPGILLPLRARRRRFALTALDFARRDACSPR